MGREAQAPSGIGRREGFWSTITTHVSLRWSSLRGIFVSKYSPWNHDLTAPSCTRKLMRKQTTNVLMAFLRNCLLRSESCTDAKPSSGTSKEAPGLMSGVSSMSSSHTHSDRGGNVGDAQLCGGRKLEAPTFAALALTTGLRRAPRVAPRRRHAPWRWRWLDSTGDVLVRVWVQGKSEQQ